MEAEIKHKRIQEFYKMVKGYGVFDTAFCMEIIQAFFHIKTSTSIYKILGKEISPEAEAAYHLMPYEDLDKLWISTYVNRKIYEKSETERTDK